MSLRTVSPRILVVLGSIAMFGGVLDPMEGSVVILFGSGMVLAGSALSKSAWPVIRYWLAVFVLIALGVAVMIGFSVAGGFGGSTGRSMWWALFILPYPVGWILGIVSIVRRFSSFLKARHQKPATC